MCEEEKTVEQKLFEIMRLQCRLMDQIRIAIEKLEKRIKGEKHPMVSKDPEVLALFKKKKREDPRPLDDII